MRSRLSGSSTPGLASTATFPLERPSGPGQWPGGRVTPEGKPEVYLYEADLSTDVVRRKVRKHCFRIKPWEFLMAGSDGSLPLEIQAAFQAARPVLDSLRETRMIATRSLTNGTKIWRKSYARLKSFEDSLEDWDGSEFLRPIYLRYVKYCHSEVVYCHRQLTLILGALPRELEGRPLSGVAVKPSALLKASK